jgi:hypothetical protein
MDWLLPWFAADEVVVGLMLLVLVMLLSTFAPAPEVDTEADPEVAVFVAAQAGG